MKVSFMSDFRPEPTRTGDHALEQLRYIRHTMDGATRFTAVPGIGMVLVGISALAVATYAHSQPDACSVLVVWAIEGVVALQIGLIALYVKTRRMGVDIARGSARKFLLALVPSGFCAVVLSIALSVHQQLNFVPAVWLTGYGTGVIAAGAHSVAVVPLMGAAFICCGLMALVLDPTYDNVLLGGAFGGLHIVFGSYIARHHGG
jgi:hypothetical protein